MTQTSLPEPSSAVTGLGSIKEVVALSGRRSVPALDDQFDGSVLRNGWIDNERGISAYTEPNFVDGKREDGSRFAHLALIALFPAAPDRFLPVDKVRFQAKPTQSLSALSVSSVSSVDKPLT